MLSFRLSADCRTSLEVPVLPEVEINKATTIVYNERLPQVSKEKLLEANYKRPKNKSNKKEQCEAEICLLFESDVESE